VRALGGGRLVPLAYGRALRIPDVLAPATLAHLTVATTSALTPPWPRIAVGCGPRTTPVLRWLKARAGTKIFTVQLMRPARLAGIDLAAIPAHDRPPTHPRGVTTLGAPHPFDRAMLDAAEATLPAAARALRPPHIAVLVGGPTRGVAFTPADLERLAEAVDRLATTLAASVLVTTSPRSPPSAAATLARTLVAPHVVHDARAAGDNPLRAFLGAATRIVVTADSASMLSEASAAGVPVHVFALRGRRRKFGHLEAALAEAGVVRPWTADAPPPPRPIDEAARLAAVIRARLGGQALLAPSDER